MKIWYDKIFDIFCRGDFVMSLTHVNMWSEHGWRPITIEEARKIYPSTVHAYSGLFMCELCGQFVALTGGDKKTQHFKHSRGETNKECEERAKQYDSGILSFSQEHDLPIRLVSLDPIELEIGLLPIPENVPLDTREKITIIPKEAESDPFVYSLARIQKNCTTYLSIGMNLASEYHISMKNPIPFWPPNIQGVSTDGTLFHGKTRKRIPYDADIEVNCDYYLLTTEIKYSIKNNVTVRLVCQRYVNENIWNLYCVRAEKMTRDAAGFFLKLHCRLTDNPVEIFPIWPATIQTPYFIHHNKNQVYMFLQGQAKAKVFPDAYLRSYECDNGKVIQVSCNDRQQFLSVGRVKILRYTYFWKDTLNTEVKIPTVKVTDFNGNLLASGTAQEVPKKSRIRIVSKYDGFLEIEKEDRLLVRRKFAAEEPTDIRGIQFGYHIKIFQGLDCVWEILYKQKKKEINFDEQAMLAKLNVDNGKQVRISHTLGATAGKLKHYPLIRQWLYQKIRRGYMSEKSYRIFVDFCSRIIE